jgi:hypothetical protein
MSKKLRPPQSLGPNRKRACLFPVIFQSFEILPVVTEFDLVVNYRHELSSSQYIVLVPVGPIRIIGCVKY